MTDPAGAGRKMLTWLGYIDGIHGAPYIAAPWIRHGIYDVYIYIGQYHSRWTNPNPNRRISWSVWMCMTSDVGPDVGIFLTTPVMARFLFWKYGNQNCRGFLVITSHHSMTGSIRIPRNLTVENIMAHISSFWLCPSISPNHTVVAKSCRQAYYCYYC